MSEARKVNKILLVDDDKVQHMINRKVIGRIDPELELVFFDNPLLALGWLEDHEADILLLDVNMPQMKGWEFVEKMQEKGIEMEVKVLTSSIDPKDLEKSKDYPLITGFLLKPIQKSDIDQMLGLV
ncbi:response regulator [Pararhodonellum marinum]|uniref:response regulator n=1 Tax=Pararhodonellum marinum TaxID=2755358 RepID=UPI0018900D62|nr:response regulator [Pararhodonellum marinum]